MQRLAAHCLYYATLKINATEFGSACGILARKCIMLDTIVTGFIGLGQRTLRAWWEECVQAIPHELGLVPDVRKRKRVPSSRHIRQHIFE